MLTKLFSGLVLATGVVAASVAGLNTSATAGTPATEEATCCSKECCKDCPNCSCECDCCKDCTNGCECPNMGK